MTDATAVREQRLETAARWWASFQESEPTQEEVLRWLAWLEADPENAEAFEQLNELAQRVHHTRDLAPERIASLRAPAVRSAWPSPRAFMRRRGRAAGKGPVAGFFSRLAPAASVLVVAGALLFAGLQLFPGLSAERLTYSTPVAGQRTVVLADGSQVTLGGATTAETAFSAKERRVRLGGGEAYFEVRADAAGRPFIVDTGLATVRVLGTTFNVRRHERRVDVTVAGGRVQVVRSGNLLQSLAAMTGLRKRPAAQAGPDEQVVIEPGSGHLYAASVDARRAGAWRHGRLEFADEPLDIVIDSVSRYSATPLRAADPRLREFTYTGTFVLGQFDSWLAALEQVFALRLRRTEASISVYPGGA